MGRAEKQFRLMGQRFVPDSYIFHRLTDIKRRMPNSLDIMAGFGNRKAYDLMMNDYKSSWGNFPDYPTVLKQIISENNAMTVKDWKRNLYYHWLFNLKALFNIMENNSQFFMTTDAWDVKSLNTALASWAELRHDTVLYAKQSVVAECGGGEEKKIEVWIPEPPKGYVEPNVEFFIRMLSLMNFTVKDLSGRKILDRSLEHLGSEFVDLLYFLKSVSEKETGNKAISLEEYEQIQKTGSLLDKLTLEALTDGANDWGVVEGPDKNMPVIADVHTADDTALEVGVGKAHEIYIIVNHRRQVKTDKGRCFFFL